MIDTLVLEKPQIGAVALNILYNPFDVSTIENHELVWQPGVTMDGYLSGLPEDVEWMLFHNGVEFAMDQAAEMQVENGDAIALIVIPTKGDTLKSILRVVVQIGFMVAGFLAGGILGMAIGAALAGLVNGFLLKPKVRKSKESDSSSYGIDGAKNSATEGIAYPIPYGEFRVAGNLSDTYTENVGDDQYLYMRMVLGDGEIDSINDIEINEQPIANFKDVSVRKSLGTLADGVNDWFRRSIRQVNKNSKINTDWVVHQTTAAVNKVRFDVGFSQGLVSISQKKGTYKSKSVTFEMEYRPINSSTLQPTGGGSWLPLPTSSSSTFGQAYDNGNQSDFYRSIFGVKGFNLEVNTPLQAAADGPTVKGQYRAIGSSTWIDATPVNSGDPTKTGYSFDPANDGTIAGQTDITPVYNTIFTAEGLPGGNYEVRSVNGDLGEVVTYPTTGSNTATVSDSRTKQIRKSFESVQVPFGFYQFRIRRTTAISTDQYEIDETYLTDVAEIETGAVALRGTPNLSIRVKLTDQLNSIPNVTARVKGSLCQQYDIDGNPTIRAWTNNQAWIALDMLCGVERGAGYSLDRIDWPRWVDFANWCTSNGRTFNHNYDTTLTLGDAFNAVLRSAHSAPVPLGTKTSVAIDRPRQPTSAFTQANIIKGSFGITYLPMADRANEFEVSYFDKTDRNKQKTIRYVDPKAVSFNEIARKSQIELVGCDNILEARIELWRNIYANRLIQRTVTFDTFLDALNVSLGDLCLVQHNQMDWAESGRLKSGSTSTVIKTDQPLEMEVGSSYALLVHFDALQVGTRTVSSIVGKKVLVSGASVQGLGASRLVLGGIDLEIISIVDGGSFHTINLRETPVGIVAGNVIELWKTDAMEERVVSSVALQVDGTTNVILASPMPSAPGEFSNFIFGKVNLVIKPYAVLGISGEGIEKRKLTMVEYQEGVYGPPEVEIPTPIGVVSDRIVGQVQSLLFDYEQLISPGRETINATLHWGAGEIRNYGGADVYMALNGGAMRPIGSAVNVTAFHVSLAPGDYVELKAVAYSVRGDRAPFTTAPSVRGTINVTPGTTNPVTGLTAAGGPTEVALKWIEPTDKTGLDQVEIWSSLTNDRATATFVGTASGTTYLDTGVADSVPRYYWARGISKLGAVGDWNQIATAGVVATPTVTPTRGAPPGTPVGSRTSDQVNALIDQNSTSATTAAAQIATISGQVDAIIAAGGQGGDGAAAAAHAAAALVYKNAAETAKTNAETAKTNAETANTNAQGALTSANTARDLAVSKASDAAGSASAAAGSATTAIDKADEADGSATSATASANLATTKSEAANTSAIAASTSAASATTKADEANTSASAANTSSVSASLASTLSGLAQAATFPTKFHANNFSAEGFSSGPLPANCMVPDGSAGDLLVGTSDSPYGIWERGIRPTTAGRKYRVHITAQQLVALGGTGYLFSIYLRGVKADGTGNGTGDINISVIQYPLSTTALTSYVFDFTMPGSTPPALIVGYRIGVQLNRKINAEPLDPGSRIHITEMYSRDITEMDAAAGSATAAATSASTAAISATNADNSASSALTQATNAGTSASNASTSASNASTSATQASTSASNAAESASTASTQATDAANSATAAGGSATAAAGSASTASTKATDADNSATSAASSSVSAASSNSAANKAAAATYPSTFVDPTQWVNYPTWGGTTTLTGGKAFTSGSAAVSSTWRMPVVSSRTYRFTARYKLTTVNAGTNYAYLGMNVWSASGVSLGVNHWVVPYIPYTESAGTVVQLSADVLGSTIIATDAGGVAEMSPVLLVDYSSGTSLGEILSLELRDVTSEVAAAGSATAAATSASTATTQAGLAGTSATSATTQANTATTQADNASSSASAASGSAATALSDANNAATSSASAASASNLAATYRDQAEGFKNTASTQAGIATSQQAIATSAAAAAQQSAILSASVGTGLFNNNATLENWPSPSALPVDWSASYAVNVVYTRVLEPSGGYAADISLIAGSQHEWARSSGVGAINAGWYVLEYEIELVSGSWLGGGARIYGYNDVGTIIASPYILTSFDIPVGYTSAVGSSPSPKRYKFSKLCDFTNPAIVQYYIGFSVGGVFASMTASGRSIVRRCGVRYATPAEIRDQTVLAPMETSVATHTTQIGALVTENNAQAISITSLNTSVSGHTTSISDLNTAVSDETSARATAISNLSSTVDGHGTSITSLGSTVTTQSSTLATLNQRTASYLNRVSAGAGVAEVQLVALDSGGVATSAISMRAEKILLGSLTVPALEIVGGVSTFKGELNVGGTSGARTNINKNVIKVFDAAGVLRVKIGDLSL
jgi:hypothetical protein